MILFRCDVCTRETKKFWTVTVSRKTRGQDPQTPDREVMYDVCSFECESLAVSKILSSILPEAKGETV